MTTSQPRKRRGTVDGIAPSDRIGAELTRLPVGPASVEASAPTHSGGDAFAMQPLPPVVVPRDENTQRVLSVHVNEWWQALPLVTRLAIQQQELTR